MNMKKIFYLLLFFTLPFTGRSQAFVVDPAQIAASFLSFLESLDQAISTTQRLGRVAEQGDSMVSRLQFMRDLHGLVNPRIQNLGHMRQAVENMYRAVELSHRTYQLLRNSRHFTHQEAMLALDRYTIMLQQLRRNGDLLASFLNPDVWRLTDDERKRWLNQNIEEQGAVLDSMTQLHAFMALTEQNRRRIDALFESGVIGSMTYLNAISRRYITSIPAEIVIAELTSNLFGNDADILGRYHPDRMDPGTERTWQQFMQSNQTWYGWLFDGGRRIFYGAAAVMALFGLVRVYKKVSANEEVFETIITWVFAVLLTVAFGELLGFFFFGQTFSG